MATVELLNAARKYNEQYRPFAVNLGGDRDKAPWRGIVSQNEFLKRHATDAELTKWFEKEKAPAVALLVTDDLLCLDFDDPEVYEPWRVTVLEHGGLDALTSVCIVATPSGGRHVWLRCEGHEVRNQKLASFATDIPGKKLTRIETRGIGGYALVPPSPGYTYLEGSINSLETISQEDLDLLLAAARLFDERAHDEPKPKTATTKGGRPGDFYNQTADWHELLESAGATIVRSVREFQYIRRPGKRIGHSATLGVGRDGDLLKIHTSNWPPFREGEVLDKFGFYAATQYDRDYKAAAKSVAHLVPPEARQSATSADREFALTDLGNAERIIAMYGGDLRYCHVWGKWLVWDGMRWEIDETGGSAVHQKAVDVFRSLYEEAANEPDDTKRKALASHAIKMESRSKIENAIAIAKMLRGVAIKPDDLDQSRWLINCRSGTIDLKTGEIRAHRREDLITRLIDCEYDVDAECPTWESFVIEVLADDMELADFVWRACGYSLTGATVEQCFFFLYGNTGNNGKSTFVETLLHLLGDYARQTEADVYLERQGGGQASNDVARLKGARFVSAPETSEGKRIDEGRIKRMTGTDRISARFLYQESFEFEPEFKLWITGNHKPTIRGTDDAIWRRVRLIPFQVTIPAERRDRHLREKLLAEKVGILRWLVRGCLAWQARGLEPPGQVIDSVQGYREEQDLIGQFLKEKCVLGVQEMAAASGLYRAYNEWCKDANEYAVSQRRFSQDLLRRGYRTVHTMRGNAFQGVSLVDSGGLYG